MGYASTAHLPPCLPHRNPHFLPWTQGNFDGSPEHTSHRALALTSLGIKFTVVLACFLYYGLVCKAAVDDIANEA